MINKLKKGLQKGVNALTKSIDALEEYAFYTIDTSNKIRAMKIKRESWQMVIDWIDKELLK